MICDLVSARLTHVGPIASRIRDMDRIECEALGRSPKDALRGGLRSSLDAYTALADGKPVAMIGVVPVSLINGKGTIWMLGTDNVAAHARSLLKYGPILIDHWLQTFETIENIVALDNKLAINLIMKLGFTIDLCDFRVHGGVEFVPFHIEREPIQEDRQAA